MRIQKNNKDVYKRQAEDIVISSRIRIARNIAQFPFENKMNDQQQKELVQLVVGTLGNINLGDNKFEFIPMSDVDEYQKQSLVERHIVSKMCIRDSPMTLRKDVAENHYRREDILRNAPEVQAGCVVVPKVVE